VWFGCDVSKYCSWKKFGLEDLQLYVNPLQSHRSSVCNSDYDISAGPSMLQTGLATRLSCVVLVVIKQHFLPSCVVLVVIKQQTGLTTRPSCVVLVVIKQQLLPSCVVLVVIKQHFLPCDVSIKRP